jgi:uncharacterized protein YvpB
MNKVIIPTSWLFGILLAIGLVNCSPQPVQPKDTPVSFLTLTPTRHRTKIPLIVTLPKPTLSPLPTITDEATPTSQAGLPSEALIENIDGHRQYFSLGCEAAASKDWANYFGYDFNEFEFQYKFPLSDNPDFGFVGDVNGPWGQVPPYAYGVHASPVAALLNDYGIPALAYKHFTLEQLKQELAAGRPVIAWVIGNCVGGIPYQYKDQAGNSVIVAAYEHVIIVTGYDDKSIRYMNNGRFYEVPTDVFLNSWSVLENMVVTYNGDRMITPTPTPD